VLDIASTIFLLLAVALAGTGRISTVRRICGIGACWLHLRDPQVQKRKTQAIRSDSCRCMDVYSYRCKCLWAYRGGTALLDRGACGSAPLVMVLWAARLPEFGGCDHSLLFEAFNQAYQPLRNLTNIAMIFSFVFTALVLVFSGLSTLLGFRAIIARDKFVPDANLPSTT
jgi:hypothetical protein